MFTLLKSRERREPSSRSLYDVTSGSLHCLQRLKLEKSLTVHDGCVNTICWNDNGQLILSGSDDQHLAITDPFTGKSIAKFRSGHRSNIFSAKFLPGSMDREVVSCSGSGEIFYTDVDREDTYGTNRFDCHFGTTYKLLVVPNEAATFLSCGDDGTVRFFDLRTKTSCSKFNCEEDVVVHLRNAVTAMAVDPIIPFHLAVASSDGIVRLYDRRMLKTRETGGSGDSLICRFPPPMAGGEKRHYRITSLNYRPGAHDVLVNYSSENIYLFNTYDTDRQQCYSTRSDPSGSTSKPVSMTGPSQASIGGTGPSDSAAAASSTDNGSDSESAFKPIKRLRLRGDWSDTGPDARPESEEPALTNTIMQRMSDLLTRMLNSRNERTESTEGEDEDDGATAGNPGDDNLGATGTSVRDETTTSTSADAAAMLRSVMFRSASAAAVRSLGNQARSPARYSISSEGLVSPELSSQDMDAGSLSEAPVAETEGFGRTDLPAEDPQVSDERSKETQSSASAVVQSAGVVAEINEKSSAETLSFEQKLAQTVNEAEISSVPTAVKSDIECGMNDDLAGQCENMNVESAEGEDNSTCVLRSSAGETNLNIDEVNEKSSAETISFKQRLAQTVDEAEVSSVPTAVKSDIECDMNDDLTGQCENMNVESAEEEDNSACVLRSSAGETNLNIDVIIEAEGKSDNPCDTKETGVSAIDSARIVDSDSCDTKDDCDKKHDSDSVITRLSAQISQAQKDETKFEERMEIDKDIECSQQSFDSFFRPTDMSISKDFDAISSAADTPNAQHAHTDPSSESNDSISEQMSTNLHIKPSLSQTVIEKGTVETEVLAPEQCGLSNIQGPSVSYAVQAGQSTESYLIPGSSQGESRISLNSGGNISPIHIAHGSGVAVNDGQAGSSSSFRSNSSGLSSLSDTPSYSENTVAMAEGALSSYEGSNSQSTLQDIARFSSLPNLGANTGVPLSEITPTAVYNRASARNPPISTSPQLATALHGEHESSDNQQDSGTQLEPMPTSSPAPNPNDNTESGQTGSQDRVLESWTPGQSLDFLPVTDTSDLALECVQARDKEEGEKKKEENDGPFYSLDPGLMAKPVLGFFTSENSEVIETAMVIPRVCVSCKEEFAIRTEDMDCLQGQERLKSGLCPTCYKNHKDRQFDKHMLEQTQKKESCGKCEAKQSQSSQPLKETQPQDTKTHQGIADTEKSSEGFLQTTSSPMDIAEDDFAASQLPKTKIDKGKGVGKSSLRAKQAEGKSSSFAPYNSGKMLISSEPDPVSATCSEDAMVVPLSASPQSCSCDALSAGHSSQCALRVSGGPSTSKQAEGGSTTGLTEQQLGVRSPSEASERHRRVGYSLPPTGNFQLYGDDDNDDDDDENDPVPQKRKMMSDRERMRQAAQKIQEVYRKKKEAREMARMMDVPQPRVLMKYSGHRNCRTMIKEANFYGDHFVMSGSDCGRILAWERETGRMVMYMDADRHVVNCVQPNLFAPVVASSGIDYDIKIWSPLHEDSQFDEEKAEMIIRRNELMLEETRDTVTVPAAFMLRILASLSQIRTGRNTARGQQAQDSSSQE